MSETRTRDMDEWEGHWEKGYCDLHWKGEGKAAVCLYLYLIWWLMFNTGSEMDNSGPRIIGVDDVFEPRARNPETTRHCVGRELWNTRLR